MDRRTFMRVGAGGVAIALLPAAGCATEAPMPSVENAAGPTAVAADGTRFETRPNLHAILVDGQRIGKVGRALGQFNYPIDVAVVGGLAYVVDMGNHRIQIVDTTGTSVGVLGDTELSYPGGITITREGEIVVADSRNARLVGFEGDGDVTRTFGEGVLSAPRGLAALDDTVLVADPGLRQVLELDGNGKVRRTFGADWILPYSVATSGDRVFVVDAATAEVAVLDRSGKRIDALALERAASFVSVGGDGILYVS